MGGEFQKEIIEHKDPEDNICSKINSLDLNSPSDIIWAYKNIPQMCTLSTMEFYRVAEMMMKHRPLDFNSSSIVLEEVGSLLQSCFGDDKDDEEINFVIERCGLEVGKGMHVPPMWCVDYFYRLVLPFSRICTKQVVDIVAFLFTRTTVAEFDELFEIFRGKKDFLVELSLLKVRLMRERREKYRCRRCRGIDDVSGESSGNGSLIEESIKNMRITSATFREENKSPADDQVKGMDFYSIESSSKDKKEKLGNGEVYSTEDLSHSHDKPFYMDKTVSKSTIELSQSESPSFKLPSSANDTDLNEDLDKCKLPSTTVGDIVFSGTDVSTAASKINVFDREISSPRTLNSTDEEPKDPYKNLFPTPLPCLCKHKSDGQDSVGCVCGNYDVHEEERCLSEAKRCLLDLETISPKFFLENIALYLSLSFDEELFLLFRKYISTEHKAICASNIFKLRKVNAEKIEDIINEIKDARSDILKADGLITTPTTLKLYVDWCVGTFNSISVSSIGDYVVISKLYIKFLQVFRHEGMLSILQGICACKIERVANIAGAYIANNLKEIVEIFLNLSKKIDDEKAGNQDASNNGEPVGQFFPNCGMEEIFSSLQEFSIPGLNMKRELEKIIIEIHKHHRRIFLLQLEVLDHFSDEFKSKIIQGLCANYDTDWRYRRELLYSYRKYPHLFRNKDILNTFTKDPVFIVRRTALDIKEEEAVNPTA